MTANLYVMTPVTGKSRYVRLTSNGDGHYTGAFPIEEGSEPGRYKLDYIYMSDRWSNYTIVSRDAMDAQGFDVHGTMPDVVAPKLVSYTIKDGDYTVGDNVPVEMVIEDETLESMTANLYVMTPVTGKSRYVRLTSNGDGHYTGAFPIEEGSEPGRYKLDYIYMSDRWSNYTIVSRDAEDAQGFDVHGTMPDVVAPKLVSYTIKDGDYTVGDSVPVEMVIEDETLESMTANLYVMTPVTGKSRYVRLTSNGDGHYTGAFPIEEGSEPGRYKLDYIYMSDRWSNYTIVSRDAEDAQGFNMRYPSADIIAPIFNKIDSISFELDEEETKSIFINASDDLKLKSAEGTFTHENGETVILSTDTVTSTGFDFSVSYDSFRKHPGQWKLSSLTISDLNQNTVTVTDGLDVTINVLPTIDRINARIVSGYEWWSYETINQDVYVLPGAQLEISSNVQINGDVYVGGRLRSYGGLDLNGEIRANYFTFGYYNPYQDGMVVMSGSNYVKSMTATNQLYGTLPFQISGAPLFEENGTVDVAGSFIPLSTLYLNGEAVTTKANGMFRLTDVVVPEDKTLRFSMTDQYGKTHRWTYKVYSRDLPVVTASLPSGIYPKGDSVTLEATKDATIYYTLNENAEPLTYGGPIQLDSSITLGYHAVDEIELSSASETKRYEVFNVHAVENEDEAIRGQAEPGTALTLTLGESTYTTTATPDGTFAFTNLTLDSYDAYTLHLQHGLLQSKPYTGVIKDVIAPIITGVTNDAYTSNPITLTFNEGVATLNGQPVSSGAKVTADGTYMLIVTDQSGNSTTRQFTIDTKAPVVSGISSRYTNKNVTLTFNEGSATLNGKAVASGTTVSTEGDYELVVRDNAGNETKASFTIDRTPVAVTGAEEGKAYQQTRLQFTEGKATLNGQAYVSDTLIEAEGTYVFQVTDLAGNVTTINFVIDRTVPNVSGVTDGGLYNKSVSPTFDEGTATLNGQSIQSGQTVSAEGTHVLRVVDAAGNVSERRFEIDLTPPVVKDVPKLTNKNVTPSFVEGTATLNGEPFVAGTVIGKEGTYMLVVRDQAGNITKVTFEIDLSPVAISGVDASLFNQPVVPVFSEGTATLNGNAFVSGQAINQDGTYELVVTDAANNITKRSFRIDQTAPVVTGVKAGAINRSVTPTFEEGTATLNGKPYTSGTTINQEGLYELIVTDEAKNVTRISFTLDWSPVVVSGVESEKHYPLATPMFLEGTATLNGSAYTSGTPITKDGTYTLVVTDGANNVTTVRFTVDHVAPVVTGVASQGYNSAVTPLFTEGTATLNGKSYSSGTAVSAEGKYELIVKDAAGNTTRVQFHLDFTQVAVSGVENGKTYQRATISFNEGTATLNGNAISTGTVVTKEGDYELIAQDEVGNKSTIRFKIDTTAPTVTGVKDAMTYQQATPNFSEGTALLNGRPFQSGTTVIEEGTHQLVVRDTAGNETALRFTIDRTKPVITGVTNGVTIKEAIVTFNEGTATLNGQAFKSGSNVTTEGTYELVVTDVAGNRTTLQFSIDRTGPTVKGVEMNKVYNQLQPMFDEGTALLNGKSFVSGTRITTEGLYELVVTDKTGNQTIIRFTVDTTPVAVVGVEDGKTYKQVLPTFSEGTVTLNGQPFESGKSISEDGTYTLVAKDAAGNETTIRFTIDNAPPVLTGFTAGKAYYRSVAPRFDEGTATLNGEPYTSGKLISQPGKYTLRLSDATGNETVTIFTIDRTAPVISGVKSRQVTNQSVTIQYNEGTATLNGKRIRNNWPVKNSGAYTLRVTDQAGNVKSLTFTIDKMAPTKPTISTLTNKSTYVSGKAEKGATVYITYNGRTYTTKASSTGSYRYNVKTTKPGVTVSVRARDAAGNTSSSTSVKVLNTFRTFTVNTVKSTSNVIIGKGNKGATVKAYVGTKLISKTAKVDSKGNYKLTISRQKPGVVVTVKMTQNGYEEVKKTTRVVK
ncbi:Ig-like domain-containing protein [Exiguobacterium sp. IPBC4]|uniref:Ig-like domain-containing protein n=2 Tax=unclassified Exiguobacterium TaxID=2644629 RepID=UPI001A956124|nr:Ig-like domain-containing protein [Exiguobacterium sp. IPBC4]